MLQRLTEELGPKKKDTEVTKEDHLHVQNRKEGRDKYKTLKQIRQGNTKSRVDEFERM